MSAARTLLVAILLAGPVGCVRRVVSIESAPPGATVWVNDREVGSTPCEFEFTHYGTYEVRLAREGHEPLVTGADAIAPWWDTIPLDLFAELLPVSLEARNAWRFELEPLAVPPGVLLERAAELRRRTVEGLSDPPAPEASGAGAR